MCLPVMLVVLFFLLYWIYFILFVCLFMLLLCLLCSCLQSLFVWFCNSAKFSPCFYPRFHIGVKARRWGVSLPSSLYPFFCLFIPFFHSIYMSGEHNKSCWNLGPNYKKILRLSYDVMITYDNRKSNLR